MQEEKMLDKLLNTELTGFIYVIDRSIINPRTTHIWSGTFSEPDKPMCKNAPYSMFRNNFAGKWCKTCVKNTLKELINQQLDN
tara:strand:+ start:1403 stop:1651 length:249 start_codon:yes stop_codon:yes gene_type:complete